jgi:hypothetical protein
MECVFDNEKHVKAIQLFIAFLVLIFQERGMKYGEIDAD